MSRHESDIQPDTVVVRSPEAVDTEVDGAVVMMSLRRSKYYGLDEIASQIWRLLVEPIEVAVLCERLLADFDVDPQTCERDVLEFLDALAAEDLIELRHAKSD